MDDLRKNHELLVGIVDDLLKAEAAYRSAMNVYKNDPMHRARLRAESDWHYAKSNARYAVKLCKTGNGQITTEAKK